MPRRGKYDQVVKKLDQIKQWRRQEGLSEKDVAARLGISQVTLESYKNKYPEFKEVMQEAKLAIISDVFSSLLKRAKGYEYEEIKVYKKVDAEGNEVEYTEKVRRHEPPNVAACSLLLKNLDREHDWSDNPTMLKVKRDELQLRKQMAEAEKW